MTIRMMSLPVLVVVLIEQQAKGNMVVEKIGKMESRNNNNNIIIITCTVGFFLFLSQFVSL